MVITASGLRQAERHLAAVDDDWAGLVRQVGPCDLVPVRGREPYEALGRSVAAWYLWRLPRGTTADDEAGV